MADHSPSLFHPGCGATRVPAMALLAVVLVTACGEPTEPMARPAGERELIVAPAGVGLLGQGSTRMLQLTDSTGASIPADSVTWFSLAPSVATVDAATGVVTAVSAGQAVIGARMDTLQAGYATVSVAIPGSPIQSWTVDTVAMDTVQGIWGVGPSVAYAIGTGASVERTAAGWTQVCPGGMSTQPADLWGVSEHDVFIPQRTDAIIHVHDRWCREVVISSRYFTLNTVWAAAPDDAWVVGVWTYYTGLRTVVFHWDGDEWRDASSGLTNGLSLRDLWGADRAHVWAVGESYGQGIVRRFDGNGWRTPAVPGGAPLNGVWGSSATDVFAVGINGRILHYDGGSWSDMASPVAADLYAVGGTAPSDVYAAGDGVVLHYDGSDWTVVANAPAGAYRSIWATSGPVYFGADGRIVTGGR